MADFIFLIINHLNRCLLQRKDKIFKTTFKAHNKTFFQGDHKIGDRPELKAGAKPQRNFFPFNKSLV